MAGLLDSADDDDTQLGLYSSAAAPAGDGSDDASTPAPAPAPAAAPSSDDTGPSWLERLGLALGGGGQAGVLSPSEQSAAGRRSLLNLGLTMLQASGAGQMSPRGNFGSILAQGLSAAETTEAGAEQQAIARRAATAELALKSGELGVKQQEAATRLALLRLQLAQLSGARGAANAAFGADGSSGTGSGTTKAAPGDFASGIAGLEAGTSGAENPNYPAAEGGPLGPHQFLASTWKNFIAANPDLFKGMTPEQALAARSDPALSTKATYWLADQNATTLKAAGIDATPQNLGIAHALGGGGAAGILKYSDDTPLSKALAETQPKAAAAILEKNPQYQGMTVGQLRAKYAPLGTTGTVAPPSVQVAGPGVPTDTTPKPPTAAPGGTGGTGTGGTSGTGTGGTGTGGTAPAPVAPDPDIANADKVLQTQLAALKGSYQAATRSAIGPEQQKLTADYLQAVKDATAKHAEAVAAIQQKRIDAQTELNKQHDQQAATAAAAAAQQKAELEKQQDQQRAAAAEAALAREGELNKDVQSAKIGNNRERLKEYNVAGDSAQALRDGVDTLELILPSVGPADLVAQMDPRVRDTLRSLNIGTDADYQKWTAQDVMQQIANRAALMAKPTGISRMSNMDVGLITGAMPRLGQSPEARQIGLAAIKTQAQIAIDERRAANASFSKNPAGASLDQDVADAVEKPYGTAGSRIPSPPPLVSDDVRKRQGATADDIAQAKAVDDQHYNDYIKGIPNGTLFRAYASQTVNGKPQRVTTLGYKRPDGTVVVNPLGTR